jgi:hypothetical protein
MDTPKFKPSRPRYPAVRIRRRVRLHEGHATAVANSADDAAGDAVLKRAERRADDDDFLARLERRSRPHLQERLRRRRLGDLQDCDVKVGRARLDPRRRARAIHAPQRHVGVLLHDVHVGDQRVVTYVEGAAAAGRGFDQHDRRHGAIDHVFE